MFDRPEIGSLITVTTDWRDVYATSVLHVQINNNFNTQTGTVVQSHSWDDPASFCITTGRPEFPVAVIPLKRVVSIEYMDGTVGHQTDEVEQNDSEVWYVEGSNDAKYTVTRNDNKWSCECKGWGFRGQCKHVNEKKQEVLNRSK